MLEPHTYLHSRYLILRTVGQGGMGAVYQAIDENTRRTVAVKESLFDDERLQRAFEREARTLNHLRHPALPVVFDHFSEEGRQFLIMQFIPGDDLGEVLKKRRERLEPIGQPKPFEVADVLEWADQLLDALDYLHSQNPPVVHRDIKPQNLKLTSDREIILLDFGLAKGVNLHQSRVTTTGSIFGYTPSYAPLEQIQGSGTSPLSDIYSLAATLYHLLTGAAPVDALTRATATISGQPDPLRPAIEVNPDVRPAISTLLMRAMAQNPAERPASASEMRQMLKEAGRLAGVSPTRLVPVVDYGFAPADQHSLRAQTDLGFANTQSDMAATITEPPTIRFENTPAEIPPATRQWMIPAAEPRQNRRAWMIGAIIAIAIILAVAFALIALDRDWQGDAVQTSASESVTEVQDQSTTNAPMTSEPEIAPYTETKRAQPEPKKQTPEIKEPPRSESKEPETKPSKEETPRVIRVSGVVLQSSALVRVKPEYPPMARAANATGTVVVEILIDEKGHVKSAKAVSGHPLLKQAAESAARRWKFAPTLIDGTPVKVTGAITFTFTR
jgi:TonB family protein